MRTSTDGGAHLGPGPGAGGGAHRARRAAGRAAKRHCGGALLSRIAGSSAIRSFSSTNGGASWGSTVLVSSISHHAVAGSLRESPLPSAAVDAAGTVYVAWADCRFRAGCTSNDIVLAKSTGASTWAAPVRVPIDPSSSTVGPLHPGPRRGPGHLRRQRPHRPDLLLLPERVLLRPRPASSTPATSPRSTAARRWSAAAQLAGPMSLSWLPNTSEGLMFGDYIATAIVAGGNAYPVIPVSQRPSGLHIPPGHVRTGGRPGRHRRQPRRLGGAQPPGTPQPAPRSR